MSLIPIPLPDLGEGVTEGEIVKIKVKEGESIVMDQILLEVMTDKASMEVPSSIEGLVKKVSVKEGDIVSVGTDLFLIETPDSKEPEENPKESSPQKPEESKEAETKPKNLKESSHKGLKNPDEGPSSLPATRKLAQELGINLKEAFKNKAKVERKDLLHYVKQQMSVKQQIKERNSDKIDGSDEGINRDKGSLESLQESPPLKELSGFKEKKREPLRGVQRLMFESMTLSKATIPHFTLGESARVDHLIQLRLEMKNRMEKQGLKVGFLPFFIKALIPVIEEFPLFNSVYDSSSKEIVFKEDLNIGFAVDSPQGLMVPVIKQLQNKSLLEIIKEIYEKAHQTRSGLIAREDLKGASLTLTNLGGLGGMYGTPIIPPLEMSILGIYKIYPQVIKTKTGNYEEKQFMNFSITCDHRFIDGATAVRFLKSFIEKIEEPSLLLL